MKSYHNTTHSTDSDLRRFETKAQSQEELIERFMRDVGHPMAPSEVQRALHLDRVPITSIRRAMTNLTKAGILEKTVIQVTGPFGRPEYRWKVRIVESWSDPSQRSLL